MLQNKRLSLRNRLELRFFLTQPNRFVLPTMVVMVRLSYNGWMRSLDFFAEVMKQAAASSSANKSD